MTNSIKFYYNGIRINGERTLIRCFYSLDNNKDHAPSVHITAREYSDHLPADLFPVKNDTDFYTDYFDTDHAYLTPDHPLFLYARAAAIKAELKNRDFDGHIALLEASLSRPERWPGQHNTTQKEIDEVKQRRAAYLAELETLPKGQPTPEDLQAVRDLQFAAESARLAQEEKERQEEREKVLEERNAGRAYILDIAERFPILDGAPVVTIEWSEHPAFCSWEDGELKLSVAAADAILKHYDEERHAQNIAEDCSGYDKTKFTVDYTDANGDTCSYTDRYDLGDNYGGLFAQLRAYQRDDIADILEQYTSAARVVSVTPAPWVESALEKRRATQNQAKCDVLDLLGFLTDGQIEEAVFANPYMDKEKRNIGRFFLQELYRRDEARALDVFHRWTK